MTAKTAAALANAAGVSVDWLISGVGHPLAGTTTESDSFRPDEWFRRESAKLGIEPDIVEDVDRMRCFDGRETTSREKLSLATRLQEARDTGAPIYTLVRPEHPVRPKK